MKKTALLFIITVILGACAISRETPAPVVNVTSPNKSFDATAVASTNAPVTTASKSNPENTTVTKINSNDDGVIVQNSGIPKDPATNANVAEGEIASTPASTIKQPENQAAANMIIVAGEQWLRPTPGKIVQQYTAALKGVDVAAPEGQDILAAAEGKVAYSGNGLKGYGNLIIIQHQNKFLTAYSHNKVNLVKEGDSVKRGQKIAEVGKTDSEQPILHFELRKSGKPLNPSEIFANN